MSTQESHEIRIPRFSFPWIPVIRDSDVQKVIIMRFYFEIKMAPYGLFTSPPHVARWTKLAPFQFPGHSWILTLAVCCGCCSFAKSCLTLCNPMDCCTQASLSFTVFQSLIILMSIESVTAIQPSHPLFAPQSFLASGSFPIRWSWPTYWNFNFSISTSNKYSELISFRIDWFDLLAVQGTLKSLLQQFVGEAN